MSTEIKDLIVEQNKLIQGYRDAYEADKEKNSADFKATQEKMFTEFNKIADAQKNIEEKQKEIEKNQALLESFQNNASSTQADEEKLKKERNEALRGFMRSNEDDKLNFNTYLGRQKELNLISTDQNPTGGFAVLPQYEGLKEARFFETSDIRKYAEIGQTAGDHVVIDLDDDEAAAERNAQRSAASGTDTPDISQLKIYVNKYDAEPGITHESLSDMYFNAESWVNAKAFDKISRNQNTDFVTGNGVGRARGFLDYSAWSVAGTYERNKLEDLTSGVSGDFKADDLLKLLGMLKKQYYNKNTVMGMKRSTFFNYLMLKKNGFGNYLFLENLKETLSGMKFMGVTIDLWDDMETVSSGNHSIVVGDFKQGYKIVDKPGIMFIRDIYSDKSRVKLYTAVRTGGGVQNFEAIKRLKIQ